MLIDKNYVQEFGLFTKNAVDTGFTGLAPHIRAAERKWLRPAMGTALYEELVDAVESAAVTDLQEALLAYVQPALLQWFHYEALPFASTKFAAIGAVSKSSADSEATSLETLKWLQASLRSTANAHTQDLVDFLNANKTDYPLYQLDSLCGNSTIEGATHNKSNTGRTLGGIFFR